MVSTGLYDHHSMSSENMFCYKFSSSICAIDPLMMRIYVGFPFFHILVHVVAKELMDFLIDCFLADNFSYTNLRRDFKSDLGIQGKFSILYYIEYNLNLLLYPIAQTSYVISSNYPYL